MASRSLRFLILFLFVAILGAASVNAGTLRGKETAKPSRENAMINKRMDRLHSKLLDTLQEVDGNGDPSLKATLLGKMLKSRQEGGERLTGDQVKDLVASHVSRQFNAGARDKTRRHHRNPTARDGTDAGFQNFGTSIRARHEKRHHRSSKDRTAQKKAQETVTKSLKKSSSTKQRKLLFGVPCFIGCGGGGGGGIFSPPVVFPSAILGSLDDSIDGINGALGLLDDIAGDMSGGISSIMDSAFGNMDSLFDSLPSAVLGSLEDKIGNQLCVHPLSGCIPDDGMQLVSYEAFDQEIFSAHLDTLDAKFCLNKVELNLNLAGKTGPIVAQIGQNVVTLGENMFCEVMGEIEDLLEDIEDYLDDVVGWIEGAWDDIEDWLSDMSFGLFRRLEALEGSQGGRRLIAGCNGDTSVSLSVLGNGLSSKLQALVEDSVMEVVTEQSFEFEISINAQAAYVAEGDMLTNDALASAVGVKPYEAINIDVNVPIFTGISFGFALNIDIELPWKIVAEAAASGQLRVHQGAITTLSYTGGNPSTTKEDIPGQPNYVDFTGGLDELQISASLGFGIKDFGLHFELCAFSNCIFLESSFGWKVLTIGFDAALAGTTTSSSTGYELPMYTTVGPNAELCLQGNLWSEQPTFEIGVGYETVVPEFPCQSGSRLAMALSSGYVELWSHKPEPGTMLTSAFPLNFLSAGCLDLGIPAGSYSGPSIVPPGGIVNKYVAVIGNPNMYSSHSNECLNPTETHAVQNNPGASSNLGLAVRCCSTSKFVSGSSPGCVKAATHAEAEAKCASEGKRLCSQSELESAITAGTGCSFDGYMTWSSTTC